MSFRVGTPNYGLPQTEGTDKRDWSDTNQPFLLIDTAIKNAVDTSASASAAAATAQQTADGANTAAAHAQTDATTAQTLAGSATELATLAKNKADANEAAITQINAALNKYHRRVAYYMNTTNKTYAQCLTEICDQLDALQLDDEQVANLCLEAGLASSSFNLFRCVRHNKTTGYYCFVGFTGGGSDASMVYSGHTTASGVASTVVEHTFATGANNDISSATNSTEWRVYV